MTVQITAAVFWSRLLKYVPYWLGVVATGVMTAQAMHLHFADPSTDVGQMIAFVGAMLNTYGIHGLAAWSPPRKRLDEMTEAERAQIFKENPGLEERYTAREIFEAGNSLNPQEALDRVFAKRPEVLKHYIAKLQALPAPLPPTTPIPQ